MPLVTSMSFKETSPPLVCLFVIGLALVSNESTAAFVYQTVSLDQTRPSGCMKDFNANSAETGPVPVYRISCGDPVTPIEYGNSDVSYADLLNMKLGAQVDTAPGETGSHGRPYGFTEAHANVHDAYLWDPLSNPMTVSALFDFNGAINYDARSSFEVLILELFRNPGSTGPYRVGNTHEKHYSASASPSGGASYTVSESDELNILLDVNSAGIYVKLKAVTRADPGGTASFLSTSTFGLSVPVSFAPGVTRDSGFAFVNANPESPNPVPVALPSSIWLFLIGVAPIAASLRRRLS